LDGLRDISHVLKSLFREFGDHLLIELFELQWSICAAFAE
jgi:hypothetical protein